MISAKRICEKNGKDVFVYRFEDGPFSMEATNYGGIIMSLCVPDRHGKAEDIVLGYDTVQEYFSDGNFFGATCGRYANRISGACFCIGGRTYSLSKNEGENQLHGGVCGFNQKVWEGRTDGGCLILGYTSPHMEEGYPGNLRTEVRFSLSEGKLEIKYTAISDRDTVINLTNHSYFNLGGMKYTVLNHTLVVNAGRYTPTGPGLIPTGALNDVEGTCFDFRRPAQIGGMLEKCGCETVKACGGYDVNFVLDGSGFRKAAELSDASSGRKMEVFTDMPGIQLYTSGDMQRINGKHGTEYSAGYGCCLETQRSPDSPNQKSFPSALLAAGETFESSTSYIFSSF